MAKNKRQEPAEISYFFKGGYIELKETIVESWEDIIDAIKEIAGDIGDGWSDGAYKGLALSLFKVMQLIGLSIFGVIFTSIFTVIHVLILLIIALFVYLAFVILRFIDTLFCLINGISTNCYNPNCERKFTLPIYICPSCKAKHYHLVPSKYGVFYRECTCGRKIPTTFINGRQRLDSLCPHCEFDAIKGLHKSILLPVVGGASAGKTCFINMAIDKIRNDAQDYNINFEYKNVTGDDFINNIKNLNKGNLPFKTSDVRFKYYNFMLTQKKQKIKTLISVCDIAGEVFMNRQLMSEQQGYRFADGILVVVDPLSIKEYKDEISKNMDITNYAPSTQAMSDILSGIINTLEGLFHLKAKQSSKMFITVVFTKLDIPGLEELIGETAVDNYVKENPTINKYDAQNCVCEKFLRDYGEVNFLNVLKSKFKETQFFSCSSLGHVPTGEKFNAKNVSDPLLWLIDKTSSSINLSNIWGKKI